MESDPDGPKYAVLFGRWFIWARLPKNVLFKQNLSFVEQNLWGHQGHQNTPSTLSLGSSIPQASSFGTRTLFLCTALKCSQILPHYARTLAHTHTHTRSYSRALTLFPCRLFNLPPFFLCCHMKCTRQTYTKTKGKSFWGLRKVCQWLFCQQPSHTKVLKTWQCIWSFLDLNIQKGKLKKNNWRKKMLSEASGLSKQQRAGGEKDAGVLFITTPCWCQKNSLINIVHDNGINSSLHW